MDVLGLRVGEPDGELLERIGRKVFDVELVVRFGAHPSAVSASSISSRCSPLWSAREALIRLLSSLGYTRSGGSAATRASVSSAICTARSAATLGSITWMRGRVESLIQSTSSGS